MGFLNRKKPKKKPQNEPTEPSKSDDDVVDADSESSLDDEVINLSPKEAFLRFDADQSGDIDSDEFYHLLECIGMSLYCVVYSMYPSGKVK